MRKRSRILGSRLCASGSGIWSRCWGLWSRVGQRIIGTSVPTVGGWTLAIPGVCGKRQARCIVGSAERFKATQDFKRWLEETGLEWELLHRVGMSSIAVDRILLAIQEAMDRAMKYAEGLMEDE